MAWYNRHPWLVPLISMLFVCSSLAVSYLVSVLNGNVAAFWPYISDMGNVVPDSAVFGQLMNMSAVLLAATICLRSKQLKAISRRHGVVINRNAWKWANRLSEFLGYLASFGVSVVANFQQLQYPAVHFFGAILIFGCGVIYIWAQSIISYQYFFRRYHFLSHLRMFLCIASTLFLIVFAVAGLKSIFDFEAGFVWHVVSSLSEWLLSAGVLLYAATFAYELKDTQLEKSRLVYAPIEDILGNFNDSSRNEQFDPLLVPGNFYGGAKEMETPNRDANNRNYGSTSNRGDSAQQAW